MDCVVDGNQDLQQIKFCFIPKPTEVLSNYSNIILNLFTTLEFREKLSFLWDFSVGLTAMTNGTFQFLLP